ncbi:MAG: hypothetical protein ACYC9O_08050 [Candidatus Latescibacterota bacterium]
MKWRAFICCLSFLMSLSPNTRAQGTAGGEATAPTKTGAGESVSGSDTIRVSGGAIPANTVGESADSRGNQSKEKAAAPDDSSGAADDPAAWTRPVFTYNSGGRRDPFESLAPASEDDQKKIKDLFNYESALLRGIVHADSGTYALAVDKNNYAYVLRENDPIYGGYVSRITGDTVYLHIIKYGRAMNIILRMDTARQTVKTEEESGGVVKRPGITVAYGAGRGTSGEVGIEAINLPSLNVKTVEETWFGENRRNVSKTGTRGAYMLLGPPDNAAVQLPEILRWTKSSQDSSYTVIVSGKKDFSEPLLIKEGLTQSSFILEDTLGLEIDRPLYWKVIATSRAGKQIDFRNNLSFRIVR